MVEIDTKQDIRDYINLSLGFLLLFASFIPFSPLAFLLPGQDSIFYLIISLVIAFGLVLLSGGAYLFSSGVKKDVAALDTGEKFEQLKKISGYVCYSCLFTVGIMFMLRDLQNFWNIRVQAQLIGIFFGFYAILSSYKKIERKIAMKRFNIGAKQKDGLFGIARNAEPFERDRKTREF
jgi:hypothetical protein